MPFSEQELSDDIAMDPNALDALCLAQSELFLKWAERPVHAKHELARQEFQTDVLLAKTELAVRANPLKSGIKNVTEGAIKAVAKSHPDYIKAIEGCLEATRESALLDKAVTAMDMKKRMLGDLITLHGQQYFAGPDVPHNLVEMWQERLDRQQRANTSRVRNSARRVQKENPDD